MRALLLQVRGREREDDALVLLLRRLIAGVAYRGREPVARLLDGLVGETDDGEVMQPAGEVGLDGDELGGGADRLGGERLGVA